MEEENELGSYLNSRRKKHPISLACCFNGHQRGGSLDVSSSTPSAMIPSPRRSPSAWIRSKAPDFPEIKGKYKKIISRMGRHRRHSSADFSYDPLSYSLNFQEHDNASDSEDAYHSFTSRLPLSPPKKLITAPASSAPLPAGILKSRKTCSERTFSNGEAAEEAALRSLDCLDLQTHARLKPEVKDVGRSLEPRGSIERSATPKAAAVAEIRRSLENITPSVVARAALVPSPG